jgi:thioredoxin-related protein
MGRGYMLSFMKSMRIPLIIGSWQQWAAGILFSLCLLLLCMAARVAKAEDAKRTIAWAETLVADAELSRESEIPIVIFVTQHGCQFCAELRRQVLYPMIRAGELTNSAIIREVSLDTGFTLQDFSANEIAGKNFASRYGAIVTPTLLFLDDDGMEIAEKMVGISNIEFYSFYLSKSIESASMQLKKSPDR